MDSKASIFLALGLMGVIPSFGQIPVPLALASEKHIVALTLYKEARGESLEGLLGVASVISNRKKTYKTLKKVCLAPKQFSCFNGKLMAETPNDKVYKKCLIIADAMVSNTFKVTHPFTQYYNPALCTPRWSKALLTTKQIGNHVFGKF